MARNPNDIYCFIYDDTGKYYGATQLANGDWKILDRGNQAYPLSFAPRNLKGSPIEFATNNQYFCPVRSLKDPIRFIKDGAAICRSLYFLGKGFEQKLYCRIIEWDRSQTQGRFRLLLQGRIDLSEKRDVPERQDFVVPVVDDSAWGVISQKDKVPYSIQCNSTNQKAIKVLLDCPTLVNNITYQTIKGTYVLDQRFNPPYNYLTILPIAIINQDGDSYEVIAANQNYQKTLDLSTDLTNQYNTGYDSIRARPIHISGTVILKPHDNSHGGSAVSIAVATKLKNITTLKTIFVNDGTTYTFDFDQDINLDVSEGVWIVAGSAGIDDNLTVDIDISNIVIKTESRPDPVIIYGVRPLDVLQDLVDQATEGRYTINSEFFSTNKNVILTSGNAVRGIQNAVIKTTIQEFFHSYDCLNFMAMRNINGSLFMEKADEIYKQDSTLIDLGEAISCELTPAKDYFASSIKVGGPVVDYRHPSGRLEVNSTNDFSLKVLNSDRELDLVTAYRIGCYDFTFLLVDYKNNSTQDNAGDNKTYMLDISDELGFAEEEVETFIELTINHNPLNPIIKSPSANDYITNNLPTVRGIALSGNNVNVYVDTVLDGFVVADANGNWSYDIVNPLSSYVPGVSTGEHTIQVSFTNLAAPNDSVAIKVDTSQVTATAISYPLDGDGLYNNKPLIRGVAQAGTNINILLDGVLLGVVISDGSCKWQFKSTVIPNGLRLITVGTQNVGLTVNSFVSFPLVTYAGSELDGFLITNNLPLIEGVAIPGTNVSLFLDYITYIPLGSAIADVSGNWSFQTVPVTYNDPVTGVPVTVAPISNGLHIVSTSLVNHTVGIGVSGFKLNRPNYSSITGVTDRTVFNTELSPKRMILARKSLFASIYAQQPKAVIKFQNADKNGNQVTVLDGVTISERADVNRSSLGNPLLMLEYAEIKTRVPKNFNDLMYDFSNGGLIRFTFRGTEVLGLPIGNMKMASITDQIQDWKILLSPLNSYITLLGLYKNGLKITLNKNEMFHSDYNTLHMVTYNYVRPPKYQTSSMYDDWFTNRNSAWTNNPKYIQKWQRTDDPLKDQIITNGLETPILRMYDCSKAIAGNLDAGIVNLFNYAPVVPNPLTGGDIVMETEVNTDLFYNGQFFFAIFVGSVPVAISERIEVRNRWNKTLFCEAFGSSNETGFFFSTGIKSKFRVEGLFGKYQTDLESIVSKDEVGNTARQYGLPNKVAPITIGNATGIPDYLNVKISASLLLDNLMIEGQRVNIKEDTEVTVSEKVPGYPMFYYNFNVEPQTNVRGNTFTGVPGEGDFEGTVLIVEPQAVGLPAGSLISIVLDKE